MSTGCQKGRMPANDYWKIQANYTCLLDHFKEPVKLANKLFEKNIIDVDQKNAVKKIYNTALEGSLEAADQLLTYVLSNCGDAYGEFIKCLQDLGYRDAVNVLKNTTNGKNKTNLMTEQDKTRDQLEELHKDHDLTKQKLENLKKQMETLKKGQDVDSKQLLKKIEKREHELETYKKQTEEKEVLTKKRMDELETCIKTLTLNDEDTRKQQQQQLFKACLHGTLYDIKNMVNIDVNVRDGLWDQTPLYYCCESRVSPVDKIKYLVSRGADIYDRDRDNNTILHWACIHGTLYTVEYLVDCLHLDLHVEDKDGETPLDCCRWSLIEKHEKIKYINRWGLDWTVD